MRTHTHAHYTTLHTHTEQSLQQPCKTQLLPPSEPALGLLCAPHRYLSLVQAILLGLVTHRRSHGERSWNPKFHNDPNITKRDKDSLPSKHQVHTHTHTYASTHMNTCKPHMSIIQKTFITALSTYRAWFLTCCNHTSPFSLPVPLTGAL